MRRPRATRDGMHSFLHLRVQRDRPFRAIDDLDATCAHTRAKVWESTDFRGSYAVGGSRSLPLRMLRRSRAWKAQLRLAPPSPEAVDPPEGVAAFPAMVHDRTNTSSGGLMHPPGFAG